MTARRSRRPTDQLDRLAERLRSLGVNSVSVPSPTSFHHPSLRAAAHAWAEELRKLEIAGPRDKVFSPIGRRFLEHDDIAATLAGQLLAPFDLQGAVADLIESGVTQFVDCGSTGALARLLTAACPVEMEVAPAHARRRELSQRAPAPPSPAARSIANGAVSAFDDQAIARDTQETNPLPLIAIVGQGCLLPGGATSPERLFEVISQRQPGVVDLSDTDPHWAADFYSEKLTPDRSTTRLMGRVNDEDIVTPTGVDPGVFAGFTRPQKLLCAALAPCVESLMDADRVMCLIGSSADGYEDQDTVVSLRCAGIDPVDNAIDQVLGTARSAEATPHSAVQEVFDRIVRPGLRVILIDAACASSLYATALGMRALEADATDAVIAGGVFCPGPGNSCLFSQFRGTTSTGLRPFDASADGTVFSEGAAVVTLRRAKDARALGLPMHAVLRGAGLSSDGRSSSANFPQTHGQTLSLERCYESYRIDPATIAAVEAHGTSTPVGDATEIETLRQFYQPHASKPLPVHSLKGLLGHGGWTAGTASVLAACEYLRRREFPPQANFAQTSEALKRADGVLKVLKEAEPLPSGRLRVAVDGFGFGGANAHLVLESHEGDQPLEPVPAPEQDEDLVVIACSEIEPTVDTDRGKQFDRKAVAPPPGHPILPDLLQDMDISQTLTMRLVDDLVKSLPDFEAQWRGQTGIVLALSGKTERGIEATMRVLASRFKRELAEQEGVVGKLDRALDLTRPSGAYTLQCMMPNVSAGRSALHYNLNGPNFVVDSAEHSLRDAMDAASLLLRGGGASGVKAVLVAAVEANLFYAASKELAATHDEFAAAFAVTTRAHAERASLPVLANVQDLLAGALDESQAATMRQQVLNVLHDLKEPTQAAYKQVAAPEEIACPLHEPVWVSSQLSPRAIDHESEVNSKRLLVLAPDRQEEIVELAHALPQISSDWRLVVVGEQAGQIVQEIDSTSITAVDVQDTQGVSAVLRGLADFSPEVLAVAETITSWDLVETLHRVHGNPLSEFAFLAAKELADQLEQGVDLWGLYREAWNGDLHAASGAAAGMFKSIQREMPNSHAHVICTRGLSTLQTLRAAFMESVGAADEQEVVYDRDERYVRRLRRPLLRNPPKPAVQLDSDSVVIATGGARGVTAVMVEALLGDFGATVVVLGRSEPERCPWRLDDPDLLKKYYDSYLAGRPDATAAEMNKDFQASNARWEAYDNLQAMSSLGGKVVYRVADITDREQVVRLVRGVAEEFGRVDLLVHGAGVQASKKLRDRDLADFRRTYKTKISGLWHLVEACRAEFATIVPAHVLTSAYSVFGNDGQHDYGAANETLDRLCPMAETLGWSSIAWLAWDGVGMTRGSEYRALAQNRGLSGVTPDVGRALFRQVMTGDSPAKINVPLSDSEHTRYRVKTIPPAPEAESGRPLELPIHLSTIQCLSHHKVRGIPTMPGAWILDRMVAAAMQLCGHRPDTAWAVVSDTRFYRFVRLTGGHEPNLRVIAAPTGTSVKLWMVGDVVHASGTILSKDVVYAESLIALSNQSSPPQARLDLFSGADTKPRELQWSDPYCDGRRPHLLDLTGPFDCVRDITIAQQGRRARFSAELARPNGELIPAYLLDSAWRVGAMYAKQSGDDLYVPVSIGRIVLPLTPGGLDRTSDWEIHTTAPSVQDGVARWDRTEAYDRSGRLGMVVENALASPLR